jgi:uncharacterized damage-inducible protein DinB
MTPRTDRQLITQWWNEAWSAGLWAASWSKSVDGLTPQQAAWVPAPGRHSIWQIVLHMIFWRESWLRRVETGQKPTDDEIKQGNFPAVTEASQQAWDRVRHRFEQTQRRTSEAIAAHPEPEADPLMYFLPHDCYHFGQINLLRALQGLPAIE